jgi:hypothetical protein
METVLESIKAAMNGYEVIVESDSSTDIPTYTVRFTLTELNLPSYDTTSPLRESNASSNSVYSLPERYDQKHQDDNIRSTTDQSSIFAGTRARWTSRCIKTSYKADLLASDGVRIFYTSHFDHKPDLIACCDLRNGRNPDFFREWKQSPIEDMVWWSAVDSFVCVTNNAVYTVRMDGRRFKIHKQVTGNWSYARVATKSSELYLWINETSNSGFDGIDVYNNNFQRLRTIDFEDGHERPAVNGSTSFCVTDKCIASICERRVRGTDHFQVNFNGFNMINFRTYYVARTFDFTMIRSDGDQQFFATTGGDRLYMISTNGDISHLNLVGNGIALTFANNTRVVVCFGTQTLEIFDKVYQ